MYSVASNSKTGRSIIFIGEIGSGKSSVINLLLGTDTAPVSDGVRPCTQGCTRYEALLDARKYNLWDTRGLGEGRSLFEKIFGGGSEKDLKKFLKERCRYREIDLVVFCIHASRVTQASANYYNTFCAITRQLVAPVVAVVTRSEKERPDMDDWWKRNASRLQEFNLEFDDYACITTLHDYPQERAESKKKLSDLITKSYSWQATGSEPYFGLLKPIPPTSPRREGGLFRTVFKKHRGSVVDVPPTVESTPPSPTVVPPTPPSKTISVNESCIDTGFTGVDGRPQSSSEDTSSARSLLHSTSCPSTLTLYSDVQLQSCIEDNDDRSSEFSSNPLNAIVRRRRNYAIQSGAYGDVWDCDLISGETTRMVAVKAMKASRDNVSSREKILRRELRVWGRLQHRNVVPLLGLVHGFGPLPSMVSPWFSNGSLSNYLTVHKTLELNEKHRLLADIIAGLCYLHSEDVIHGDLHSGNVLIDDHGTACLTDFGLSLINEFVGTSYLKSSVCGDVQFADPMLVQRMANLPEAVYPTKPSDIYSFGGLMLHVLSGKKPYDGIQRASIFILVLKGNQSRIPTHRHIMRPHKSLIQSCWDREEHRRPSADDVMKMFIQLSCTNISQNSR